MISILMTCWYFNTATCLIICFLMTDVAFVINQYLRSCTHHTIVVHRPSRVQSSPGPRPSASAVTPAPARPATAQPAVPAASTTTPASGGAPPAAAAAAAGAGGASGQATPIQLSDLQNILSNLNSE